MTMMIGKILKCLNQHRIRATYGAVAEVLGVIPIAVGKSLGDKRPVASWVVSSATGKPSGYAPQDCHPDLYANERILTSGDALRELMSPTDLATERLIGVDLAWISEKNGSGIAIGTLSRKSLLVEEIHCGVKGMAGIMSTIAAAHRVSGIAVDAPLIINNLSGNRRCESNVSSTYGSRHAGCHSSNQTNFPDAASVQLSLWLESRGHAHLGAPGDGAWQIECYPHPAIIEIFGLERRLSYKKSPVQTKKTGQATLARLMLGLQGHAVLSLTIPDRLRRHFDAVHIMSLRGQALKDNEDALDSVLCLYIAGLYALGQQMQVFGDAEDGYIVVPNGPSSE